MSTTKENRDFILTKFNKCEEIFCRSMMGEYLLYSKGVLFGGIYDNKVLFKITNSNKKYNLEEVIPYKGAKPMFYFEDVDNAKLLSDIVNDTCFELSKNKKK